MMSLKKCIRIKIAIFWRHEQNSIHFNFYDFHMTNIKQLHSCSFTYFLFDFQLWKFCFYTNVLPDTFYIFLFDFDFQALKPFFIITLVIIKLFTLASVLIITLVIIGLFTLTNVLVITVVINIVIVQPHSLNWN